MLNGEVGGFIRNKDKMIEYDLYLGGHPEEKEPANVYLSNFEIYSKMFNVGDKQSYTVCSQVLDSIDRDYASRVNQFILQHGLDPARRALRY